MRAPRPPETLAAQMKKAVLAGLVLVLFNAAAARADIYFGDHSDGTAIGRANDDGSAVNLAFITGASSPCGMAADRAHLYWANEAGHTIGRANLDGTSVDENFIDTQTQPCGVAVDAGHVYWANTFGSEIGRARLDGSAVQQDFIQVSTANSQPCGIAVDGAHLYWASHASGRIARANLDGTGANEGFIDTAGSGRCGVAVDAAHLYWADQGSAVAGQAGSIGRAQLDGTGVTPNLIGLPSEPCGVAVDGAHVYWGNGATSPVAITHPPAIGRANLDGSGANTTFIPTGSGSAPCAMAVGTPPPAPPPARPPPGGGVPPPGGAAHPVAQISQVGGVRRGARLLLSAAGSLGGGAPIARVAWDFNGDGRYDGACPGSEPIGIHAFAASGVRTIGLRIIDADGSTATTTQRVAVSAVPGAPKADPRAAGEDGYACAAPAPDGQPCVKDIDLDGQDAHALGAGCFVEAPAPKTIGLAGGLPTGAPAGAARAAAGAGTVYSSPVNKKIFGKLWQSRGPFAINGLEFDPKAGVPGYVDERTNAIDAQNARVRILDTAIVLSKDRAIRDVFPDVTGASQAIQMPDFPDVGRYLSDLFGFKLIGSVTPRLVNGKLALAAHIGIPAALSADVTLVADNGGLHLDEIHAHSDEAPFGLLDVRNLDFDYKPTDDSWEGGATIVLSQALGIHGTIGFKHGDLDHLGAALDLNGVGYPLVPPLIVLNQLGVEAGFGDPVTLTGTIELTAGGKLEVLGGNFSAADLTGTVKFTASDPWALEAKGDLKLLTLPFANAFVKYVSSGSLTFGGDAHLDFEILHAHGHVGGFFTSLGNFQADADVEGCIDLLGCAGAEAVVSSKGAGICADLGFVHAGGGLFWDGRFVFMADSCDIAQFRVAGAGGTRAAAAGDAAAIAVPGGLPAEVFAVHGAADAPNATVVAPDGTQYASPDGSAVRNDRYVWFREPSLKTTYVIVARPAPGRWTVASGDVSRVEVADALPAPSVRGSATRRGGAEVLRYRAKVAPGERVAFAETGTDVAQALGTARGAEGTLRFTPAPAGGRSRQVVALVTRNGLPVTRVVVARYRAPAPRPPRAVRRLRIARRGSTFAVSWRGEPGVEYRAAVHVGDGRRLTFVRRGVRARIVVHRVLPQYGATVTVRGRGATGLRGATARARVSAP
ncbi:MAG TPA: hypothetical protein VKB54_09395 [Solirubrobacteraceae bacterium]|nr:hypothetical protein [Solirubrobacteraceae bacterium]